MGHVSAECSRPDRRANCYKCGEEGHSRIDCKSEAAYVLCKRHGHESGGSGCPEAKAALDKEYNKIRIVVFAAKSKSSPEMNTKCPPDKH